MHTMSLAASAAGPDNACKTPVLQPKCTAAYVYDETAAHMATAGLRVHRQTRQTGDNTVL